MVGKHIVLLIGFSVISSVSSCRISNTGDSMVSVHPSRIKGPIIIHKPSFQYSYGAGAGLSLDAESDALILQSDMTNQVFVLLPSPGKIPRVNGINDLEAFNGVR